MGNAPRRALGGIVLSIILGFGAATAATPARRGRAAPGANPYGATPDNPYAGTEPESAPTPTPIHASIPGRADATPDEARADTPPESDAPAAEPGQEPAEEPAASPGAEQLAEEAARTPAPPPPSREDAIAALDAVLLDETADPISGVPIESAPEPTDEPSRQDVQEAFSSVMPALRWVFSRE